jgi:L-2-hydroxyglutarate oxidase
MERERADLVVIGGGIVGLAAAESFQRRYPGLRAVVLEKEAALAAHQTGRNSGVVHSGIYYRPGSRKAESCRRGRVLLERFCRDHGVAHETCGKVVVAVDESELPALERIRERALANGVACRLVDPVGLRELEPRAAGARALHVPETGIADYPGVCARLAALVRDADGDVRTSSRVVALRAADGGAEVDTERGDLLARAAVNCAGLHSDRVLAMSGQRRPARIVPFRGEYFELAPEARALVRNLIYPVPDPRFPFLGVHFTRTIAGAIECGPNAVLALAREGYSWRDVRLGDVADFLGYSGFWRLAARHGATAGREVWRSLSRAAFARSLQRLVPDVRAGDLRPAPAGVRAQALAPDGALVDDFLVVAEGPFVHVVNAPSPAATAALAIGAAIVERLEPIFGRSTAATH